MALLVSPNAVLATPLGLLRRASRTALTVFTAGTDPLLRNKGLYRRRMP